MDISFAIGNLNYKSGIVKVVLNIVKELNNIQGYNVSIICLGDSNTVDNNLGNVKVYDLELDKYNKRQRYLYYISSIKKMLRVFKPDIIVVSGMEHIPFYTAACKQKKIMLIAWEHLNFDAGPKLRLEWIGKRIAIKRWDGIVCITKKDYNLYVKHSIDSGKIHQIYNLTDFNVARKKYDMSSKKIMSCGYLSNIKGFDMLIQVGQLVFRNHHDWKWDIYGEGAEREILEELINKNGLSENIHLKGYTTEINQLYSQYSFFVLTSRAEGMGMVLIEAQKAGLPVVSFDIKCGPSDVIEDGKNGFLIKPFEIKDMADKINVLIENDIMRNTFSDQSEIKLKEFNKQIIINKWINLLNKYNESEKNL